MNNVGEIDFDDSITSNVKIKSWQCFEMIFEYGL